MVKSVFERQNPWRNSQDYRFEGYHKRGVLKELIASLEKDQILGITGSRQVGKSSLMFILIEHLLRSATDAQDIYYFNLDEVSLHELFHSEEFLFFVKPQDKRRIYIFIDEIQRLPSPGLFLKALYDLKLNIKWIYSGSSQLDIHSKGREHLVGRVRTFEIQRLNWHEGRVFAGDTSFKEQLQNHLLYGGYPAVMAEHNTQEKQLLLRDIYQTYVQKDVAELMHIDNVEVFNKLLILLAQQIGGLLNITGLASALRVKREKIEYYLDVLEQTYIIKRIPPFYQNYRKEITKTPKIYFLDIGLRNFILKNFLDLPLRRDKGALFENFFLCELLSRDIYGLDSIHFWRTTNQTEIDFIRRTEKGLEAIETKFSPMTSRPRSFASFSHYYPEASCRVASTEDFRASDTGAL